VKSYKPA